MECQTTQVTLLYVNYFLGSVQLLFALRIKVRKEAINQTPRAKAPTPLSHITLTSSSYLILTTDHPNTTLLCLPDTPALAHRLPETTFNLHLPLLTTSFSRCSVPSRRHPHPSLHLHLLLEYPRISHSRTPLPSPPLLFHTHA